MRLSNSLLLCLSFVPFAVQGLGCGGDDPPTVKSSNKNGRAGSAGSTAGAAGADAAGAAGSTAAGAAGTTAAGAAGATAAGASGAGGEAAGAAGATAGGAAGATAGGAAGVTAGGAAGNTAAGNGGAGGMVKPKGAGYVEIFAGKESATAFRNDGKAKFVKAPAEGSSSPCTTTDLGGGCTTEVCTAPVTGEVIEDAGSIDVQVVTATGPVTKMKLAYKNSTYSVDETMYPLPKNASIYSGGEQLILLATGFDAPGFNTETFAPNVYTLTSPAPGNVGQPVNVDTKADLPITFSGSGKGGLEVRIESSRKDNPLIYTKLVCYFPAGTAGAKIPATALAKLPAADAAQYNTSLGVLSLTSAPVDNLQSYTVKIRATTHVLDGMGAVYGPQQVTLK